MVPLDEVVAVARSRPSPTGGHLVAAGLTDEEWDAFIRVLEEDRQMERDRPTQPGSL